MCELVTNLQMVANRLLDFLEGCAYYLFVIKNCLVYVMRVRIYIIIFPRDLVSVIQIFFVFSINHNRNIWFCYLILVMDIATESKSRLTRNSKPSSLFSAIVDWRADSIFFASVNVKIRVWPTCKFRSSCLVTFSCAIS